MSVLGFIVLGGLAGCGDNQGPPWVPAAWHNGTRLRAKVADAGGGAVQFFGWYDTALGVDCAFEQMTDRTMRCLPTDAGDLGWGDDSCSQFVVVSARDVSCPAPAFMVEQPPTDGCHHVASSVAQVGASRGVTPIYVDTGFACEAYPDEWPTFEIGPWHSNEEFVAADVIEVERPGGITARVAVAEDGAQQVLELANRGDDTCKPVDFLDGGGWRCVVAAVVRDDLFGDSDCTVPAPPIAGCREPEVLVAADGHVYLPGEHHFDVVYWRDGETCAYLGVYSTRRPGARADANAFPPLSVFERGAGAVQARFTSDVHGDALMPAGLFERATGTACRPTAEAGAPDTAPWRCVPTNVPLGTSLEPFGDAACTVLAGPLIMSRTYGARRVAFVDDVVCDARHPPPLRRLVEVQQHVDSIYQMIGGQCREVDYAKTGFPYDVIAEVPMTSLPAVTIRVE
ncbi:MAG: hypothetical protein IPL61_12990 [Myxococcales bacterium]|nr:hypothetical protein [Myxococcales bacterium]